MTKEELRELAKNAQGPSYIRVEFGYHYTFIFPYAKGKALMEALENYEIYDSTDYNNPVIRPAAKGESPEITIVSRDTYVKFKMAHLLGINQPEEPA